MSTHYFSCSGVPGAISIRSVGTRYAEFVILHSMGSAGYVVHYGAFRLRNVYALFFMLWWDQQGFHKKHAGHFTPKLCFCYRWDLRVTYCIPVCLGHETSMHYFSCTGGPSAVSIKSVPRLVTLNLCFCIR
jgi:hypothetical protein